MKFREYDASQSHPPHKKQPYVEYHLSAPGTGVGSTSLHWSYPKPTSASCETTKLQVSQSNTARGIIKATKLRVIHTTAKIDQLCRDLFLPIGYPNSVAEGYLEYQFYDSVQGLCSYLRGVVSTSAVLSATGVGDAQATAMSAAMTWAVRDGLGMIGGLFFSYVASPHFDAHVKEFRLLADILNDVALTLDMALPLLLAQHWISSLLPFVSDYLPSSYLVLTSTSMLCKVACGMAAGATKGTRRFNSIV